MGDSSEMTVEFLRARLLSERSISKSARQRADQLAKRVLELEELLKLVTLQRNKAEKATSEVLAVLENHGISDISEVIDSSSDQEVVGNKSLEVKDDRKEDVGLTVSSPMRTKVESSGSGPGESPLTGRRFSWKSCSSSPNSLENAKFFGEGRRSSSIASNGGLSTRHHLGKSRRQMKQRKMRSAEVEVKVEPLLCDARENVVVSNSGEVSNSITDIPHFMEEGRQIEDVKVYVESLVQDSLDYQRKNANDISSIDGIERNAEMERALEHQARLIGQYEAQENAQREWEDKFKENNCHNPDSIEHGNQSDITEERDGIREEALEVAGTVDSREQEGESRKQQVHYNGETATKDFTEKPVIEKIPDGFPPYQHNDSECSHERKQMSSAALEPQNSSPGFSIPSQDNPEARPSERRKQERLEENAILSANCWPLQHQAALLSSIHVNKRSDKGESSQSAIQGTHRETPSSVGGVLDALQQAKLSIKHKLDRRGSSTGGRPVMRSAGSPMSAITAGNFVEIPVGSAGLSRVPTRSEYEALTKPNRIIHNPDFGSSLARYYPGSAVGSNVDGRHMSNTYPGRSSVNSAYRPPLDPYIGKVVGLPSSTFLYPSYIDLMPRMSSKGELSRLDPSMGLGMAAEDHYLDYNARLRSDMYKR